jgi:hypothetical protein
LTAAILCASAALAQSNTGNISGRITDEQGSPIPGGTVTLIGPAAPRTASGDANGHFRFFKVAPGEYTLVVRMAGFSTETREGVWVLVAKTTEVVFPMRLAAREDVLVGAPPLTERGQVETGQTFSGAALTEIPTARDVWSLIQQVPGVQLDTVNVAGNASAVIGGPGISSKGSGNVAYEVDGATITGGGPYGNPFGRQNGGTGMYFDFSTFENVEVTTGGSILDQQNSGVTINVVTRRGTNQLKGSGRFLYASAAWQSDNTPREVLDQNQHTNNTRYIREYGADLGGPIVKDRLWIWASGSRQDISLNPGTSGPALSGDVPFPDTTILKPWSAKLNAQISNANSASLFYEKSNRLEYGVGGDDPYRPPETRTNDVIPTSFYKAEDSHVFSPDLFGSVFLSYQDAASSSTPIGGVDKDLQFYDHQFHVSWQYSRIVEPQKQGNLQASRFFNTGRIAHELKASFNYRQQIADSTTSLPGSQSAGGDDTFFNLAEGIPGYTFLSRGVRRVFERRYWSGTLGDTLTSGNLTIAAGLRYDLQQAKSLPGEAFGNAQFANPCTKCGADGGSFPGLPDVKGQGAKTWQIQYSNLQPRISATYALGSEKRTLMRASYARFADQIGYLGYWASTTPVMTGYYYYWTDLNHDRLVQPNEVLFSSGPNGYLGFANGVDPTSIRSDQVPPDLRYLKTPMTDEFTGGIDHQLTDDLAVSGTFSYRTTAHLQQHLPVGADLSTYAFLGRAQGTATAANGFSITFDEPYWQYIGQPADTATATSTTVTNRPGATQRYYGVDVSVVKRLSHNWMLRATFGWSSFRQYLTPESIQNPNNLADPWVTGNGSNDNGGLANANINASWQFNVNALYQGPWGLVFGANFFGRQGYPIPYFVAVQTEDLYFSDNFQIGRADDYRYPNVYELDLRVQRPFPVGPVTLIPIAELFNAANGNAVLARNNSVGFYNGRAAGTPDDPKFSQDPYFNSISQIQSPRIVRLGIQVSF